jgi:uncharacterized protein (DUF924 family)
MVMRHEALTPKPLVHDVPALTREILEYWFATIDDATPLDRETEPFRSCFARWYGKRPEIDAEIRERFEPALVAVTHDGRDWDRRIEAWRRVPDGLVALTILLDQLPRNMYRGTARMYVHDPLALVVAAHALHEPGGEERSLVRRMFLLVPFMHVENLTFQQAMVARFEDLVALARTRSPANLGFYENALDFARRHLAIIEGFGRFPHRNALLGRTSTLAEQELLRGGHEGF